MSATSITNNNLKNKQFEMYEQIIAKFLLNLPLEQRRDQSRVSFHAEKAWYYYIDVVLAQQCKQKQKLPKIKTDGQTSSSHAIDQNSPELRYKFFQKLRLYSPKNLSINPDLIIKKLQQNKPTCGAIIFNQSFTKVLIIKNKQDRFGFPKGKWNQHQKPQQCAARQVYQQIGIYLHTRIDPSQKVEFINSGGVPAVFFIVKGVKQNEKLTIDKKEINEVFWMNADDVIKYQKRFVKTSRTAWQAYLDEFDLFKDKVSIQEFIEYYKPSNPQATIFKPQPKGENSLLTQQKLQQQQNPFLNFKLDNQKLMKALLISS